MKRLSAILTGALATAVAHAGGDSTLGTKPDLVSNSAKYDSGPGLMPLFQTILVLGVVLFILKTVGPKVISKLGKKLNTSANGLIKVEESATFAGGSLYVVEARGKTLLLSVGAQGVSCLADLTVVNSTVHPPLFMDMVADAESRRGDDVEPPHPAIYLEGPAPAASEEAVSPLRNAEIESLRINARNLS